MVRITHKFLDFFFNKDSDEIIDYNYENQIKWRRHLNEFGQIMSAGTYSPDESTVYGRVIYKTDDNNQTEGTINVIKDLQDDGPTSGFPTTPQPIPGHGKIYPNEPDSNNYAGNNPNFFPPGSFFPPVSVKPTRPPVLTNQF